MAILRAIALVLLLLPVRAMGDAPAPALAPALAPTWPSDGPPDRALAGARSGGVEFHASRGDRDRDAGAQYLRAMLGILIGAQGLQGATGTGLRARIGLDLRF